MFGNENLSIDNILRQEERALGRISETSFPSIALWAPAKLLWLPGFPRIKETPPLFLPPLAIKEHLGLYQKP